MLNTQRQGNEKERFALGYYPGGSAVSESKRLFVRYVLTIIEGLACPFFMNPHTATGNGSTPKYRFVSSGTRV